MYMLSQALQQAQVELGLKIIALWQCKVYSRSLPRFSNVVTECLYFFLLCLLNIVVHSPGIVGEVFHCCLLFRSIVLD